MALEVPLRSSRGFVLSFSSYTERSISLPESPARNLFFMASSTAADSLRSHSFTGPSSAHLLLSSSSDIVGPSPVTSNGTDTTELEDDVAEEPIVHEQLHTASPAQLMMLRTNLPDHLRIGEEVVSVIHAPQGFQSWKLNDLATKPFSDGTTGESARPPSSEGPDRARSNTNSVEVNTKVKPVQYGMDAPTPQAQNLQDVLGDKTRLRSGSASSLGQIPETLEHEAENGRDDDDHVDSGVGLEMDSEVQALTTALEECWSLCNTLANLSSIHRERVFHKTGTPDAHEKAWKSCWKLCKRLYQSRDDVSASFNVRTNLDLCRGFCQTLFDLRVKNDEIGDSVLRVSFELNNHLYSAQDSRNLPEAFRERTLDFYITLCHRLMKRRSEMADETDSLLRACWSLAEMLFSLRTSRRDGKDADEELLGSAVQACWELCDIFREGWTQIRPDRRTPRPSHLNFFSPSFGPGGELPSDSRSQAGSWSSVQSKRGDLRDLPDVVLERPRKKQQAVIPETPVTEFEDTPISPESSSPQMPNIMVLGASSSHEHRSSGGRGGWSSSASNLSCYSHGSARTSSTATTTTATAEDANIANLKVLVVKAAMNLGYAREDNGESEGSVCRSTDGGVGWSVAALQVYVKSLPTGSFGPSPAHATLLQNYKNLVLADSAFRTPASLPPRGKRVGAADVAKSVGWMMVRQPQYGFLRQLFRYVFGFQLEEAGTRKDVPISV